MTVPFIYIVYDDSVDDDGHHANFFRSDSNKNSIYETVKKMDNVLYRKIPKILHRNRRCLFPNTLEPSTENAVTRCADVFQYMFRDEYLFCSNSLASHVVRCRCCTIF